MLNEPVSIEIKGEGIVSAVLSGPDQHSDSNKTGVVFAHGAANDMNNRLIVAVADGLAVAGFTTLRFNFPYKERGRKSPDSEATPRPALRPPQWLPPTTKTGSCEILASPASDGPSTLRVIR